MEELEKITDNDPDKTLLIGDDLTVKGAVVFPFEKAANFSNIPNNVIKRVSLYHLPVIYKATPNRVVNIESILVNAKALFTQGRYYYDKEYWVQHCASSFREILVFIDPSHFKDAYSAIPDPESPEVKKAFIFLSTSTSYLSHVVHHQPEDFLGDAHKLYPLEQFGTQDKDEFIKNHPVFFERLCIDVVYTLDHIFKTYCETTTNETT